MTIFGKHTISLLAIRKGVTVISLAFLMAFSIVFLHANSQDIPTVSYLGNYPSDKWGNWTERLQGVGNSSDSWFFTQLEALWKVPLAINLDHSKNMWPSSDFPGVLRVEMPDRTETARL